MRAACYLLMMTLLSLGSGAKAAVYSPSSIEVAFDWTAHFKTTDKDNARDLAIDHGKNIFGFMQNPDIGGIYGLNENIVGIGAPRWEPKIEILSDQIQNKKRFITYRASGLFILNREVAKQLMTVKEKDGSISGGIIASLPNDPDHFYFPKCGNPEYNDPSQFWYVNNPFADHCEFMRKAPVASDVVIHFRTIPQLDESAPVDLAMSIDPKTGQRIFEITSISGFEEEKPKRRDEGRVNYNSFNRFYRTLGFKERVLQSTKSATIHLFEKTLTLADGKPVQVRLIRLLAQTMLDESEDPTFARFVERAFKASDVVVYEGHSGLGANLSLDVIAKKAGAPVVFDRTKKQLFFFNSCSSYSYYLSMFKAQKNPGTLAIMSNGLEADFTPPEKMMQFFFKSILAVPQGNLTWKQLLDGMEQPLDGNTYMTNVDLN